ncbi:AHR protein, partial [Amia calva]|nr:AHR protein [Amia calva]
VKTAPAEGVKSNPSKRHRDRLNSELDRLASLLPFPEEVTSSLDKLSILRLSVSYLRAKNFFTIALKNRSCKGVTANTSNHDNNKDAGLVDSWLPEGELLLQALNGFVLVISSEGLIFYASHTIQDYLGFHQTDVMHQSVFELIHTEDQQEFRKNLHWALNPPSVAEEEASPPCENGEANPSLITYNPDQLPPENSSFLERSFVCRFRCLLDNSSGFLVLNLLGRLKFLHGQNRRAEDGCPVPPQLALFAIATPLQPPSILEIRTKNMIFRTKHKLDFTPMACDAKGKIVLGYTEAELRARGTGYQFIHAADMLYCAENHVRMIKTGESGLTVFRLLTKENRWKWVQANARLVYKNGKPDYIIATQRPLVEEEGGEHLRKRSMHLPFTFATGEALLYQTSYPLTGFPDAFQGKGKGGKSKNNSRNKADKNEKESNVDPNSLLGAMMRQNESVYVSHPALEPKFSFNSSLFSEPGGSSSCAPPSGESWSLVPNSVTELKPELPSFDPLLSTLDSLCLDSDENCSNNELFSALENLGLNAEDLELLLLDERMIRVEVDQDYIPSLNDLLTNNEILSFIHDSLESRTEEGGGSIALPCPQPDPPQAMSKQPCMPHAQEVPPQYLDYRPQQKQPILQLSQQMQEHLKMQVKEQPWGQHLQNSSETQLQILGQPSPAHEQPQTSDSVQHWDRTLQNGHWITQHMQMSVGIHGQSVSQVGLDHLSHQQSVYNGTADPSVQAQLHQQRKQQQNQLLLQLQSQCHFKQKANGSAPVNGTYSSVNQQSMLDHQWQGYSYTPVAHHSHVELPANVPGFNDGQEVSFPQVQASGVSHMDYNMSGIPGMDFTMNGGISEDGTQYQGVVATASSYQVISQKQQQQQQRAPQVSTTCFSQYQPQDTSLEQILGMGQTQQLPSLESYGMFTTAVPQDGTPSKV